MVFSSMTFLLLFLPMLLLMYFIRGGIRWRNAVLVAASLVFYAWGEPVFVLGMLFSTAVNYLCARVIDASGTSVRRKAALVLGVGVSLGFLFYFKYYAFVLENISSLFSLHYHVPEIRLPIGISFYTFQVLTYTVDVYRGTAPVQRSFWKLLLYVSCFPQLIAGPIVQYADVASQLDERSTSVEDFTGGMRRFIAGLSKKVLLANVCGAALSALPQGTGGEALSFVGAWYLTSLYSLQLYFDFSAYSDMAIGLGRILGFRYKENFNYPYVSLSATEFWRRWHISLGSFFRDYVYIPLGGNRRGALRTGLNILIVWTLTGLWHGAAWNFILWGFYFGVILLLERSVLKKPLEKLPTALRWALTALVVTTGWAIFYHTDAAALGTALRAMFGIGAAGLTDPVTMQVMRRYSFFPLIAFVFSLPAGPAAADLLRRRKNGERVFPVLREAAAAGALFLSMVFLVGQSYNPFIYFRF